MINGQINSDTKTEVVNSPEHEKGIRADIQAIRDDGSYPVHEVIVSARIPHIENLLLIAANTEKFFRIPNGTKKFTLKARGGDIQFSYAELESNVRYILLPNGSSISNDEINAMDIRIFAQSPNANAVLEIEFWR